MTGYQFAKPKVRDPFAGRAPVRFDICQHVWGQTGRQCCAGTENGAAYCAPCAKHLLTYLDRPVDPVKRVAA